MKIVRIIEDYQNYTVKIIKEEIETPEFLSAETVAQLEAKGDIIMENAIQKYKKDEFWKVIEGE